MPRRLLALVALQLFALTALADDKPVVPPEPEYECRFDDGSVVRLTVGTSAVVVRTRFGPMTVPLADTLRIQMGVRYPEGVEAKVRQALDDLGSPDFRTREAAQKSLVGFGEYAVPLVKAGTSNTVPEVAERCAAILKSRSGIPAWRKARDASIFANTTRRPRPCVLLHVIRCKIRSRLANRVFGTACRLVHALTDCSPKDMSPIPRHFPLGFGATMKGANRHASGSSANVSSMKAPGLTSFPTASRTATFR